MEQAGTNVAIGDRPSQGAPAQAGHTTPLTTSTPAALIAALLGSAPQPMTTLLSALQGAESLLLAAARIWAVAGELITAGALLLALDRFAAAIRLAYRAGFIAGQILWPVIHALAAAGRWLWAHIDWLEVWAVIRATAAALVALAITAGERAIPALCSISEALGRRYSRLLVGTTTTPQQAPAKPVPVVPAAVTTTTATTESHRPAKAPQKRLQAPAKAPAALEALPVKELRQLARKAGHKALARSGRKAELLVALAA